MAGRPALVAGILMRTFVAVDGAVQLLGLLDGACRCRGPGAGRPRSRRGRRRPSSARRSAGTGRTRRARRRSSARRRPPRRPCRRRRGPRGRRCSGRPWTAAAWKIDGLVVTPTTLRSLIEVGELAGLEQLAGQVVEPDRDAGVGEGLGVRVGHAVHFPLLVADAADCEALSLASTSEPMTSVEALWAARSGLVSVTRGAVRAEASAALRESLAALTTASAVMPNSRKRVAWSAEAPKCSMLTAAAGVADDVVPAHRDRRPRR